MPRQSTAGRYEPQGGGICFIQSPQRFGQQLGQHEEPQEHLHQQRDVAEDLDVGGAQPRTQRLGVVRSVPISEPRASAMTQAASAVASVQPRPTMRYWR